VPGGHRGMCGEYRPLGHLAKGVVEPHPVGFHPFANRFEWSERTVPFVEMISARRDPQGPQGLHPTDPEYQFLSYAGSPVTTVESGGKFAILGTVPLDIAIEQVQPHTADV